MCACKLSAAARCCIFTGYTYRPDGSRNNAVDAKVRTFILLFVSFVRHLCEQRSRRTGDDEAFGTQVGFDWTSSLCGRLCS